MTTQTFRSKQTHLATLLFNNSKIQRSEVNNAMVMMEFGSLLKKHDYFELKQAIEILGRKTKKNYYSLEYFKKALPILLLQTTVSKEISATPVKREELLDIPNHEKIKRNKKLSLPVDESIFK